MRVWRGPQARAFSNAPPPPSVIRRTVTCGSGRNSSWLHSNGARSVPWRPQQVSVSEATLLYNRSGVGTGTGIDLGTPGSIAYGNPPQLSRYLLFHQKGGMRL